MTPHSKPIRLPKALSPEELDALRAVPKNARDQALIEVMAGCGLRVSEATHLRLDGIHWSSDKPALRFTGKRDKERVVPMNLAVQDALRRWLEQRGNAPSDYVFCNLRTGERLSRKTVWDAFKRYAQRAGCRHIHPHMLRHSFGTALANRAVGVERIRELMGHASIETSQIYISVSTEQKRQAVEQIDYRSRLARWWSRQRNRSFRFFNRTAKPRVFGKAQTVGRREELVQLQEHLQKGIDTLVLGPTGVGKSHLLHLLEGKRLLRLPSLIPIRQAVISLAEALHIQDSFRAYDLSEAPVSEKTAPLPQNGETAAPSPARGLADRAAGRTSVDFDAIKKQHTRTGVQGWVQMVLDSVEKGDWTLVIDDLGDMTAAAGRILDRLQGKFCIIAALPQVKKAHEKHFWKFERLELKPLPVEDARRLIRLISHGAEIEDRRMFETHLLQKTAGNPRAILESVERLRKEPAVTRHAVRELAHSGGRNQIDLTPIVLIPVLLLLALRFVARGLGDIEFYVVAGIGSAFALGIHLLFSRMRGRS